MRGRARAPVAAPGPRLRAGQAEGCKASAHQPTTRAAQHRPWPCRLLALLPKIDHRHTSKQTTTQERCMRAGPSAEELTARAARALGHAGRVALCQAMSALVHQLPKNQACTQQGRAADRAVSAAAHEVRGPERCGRRAVHSPWSLLLTASCRPSCRRRPCPWPPPRPWPPPAPPVQAAGRRARSPGSQRRALKRRSCGRRAPRPAPRPAPTRAAPTCLALSSAK